MTKYCWCCTLQGKLLNFYFPCLANGYTLFSFLLSIFRLKKKQRVQCFPLFCQAPPWGGICWIAQRRLHAFNVPPLFQMSYPHSWTLLLQPEIDVQLSAVNHSFLISKIVRRTCWRWPSRVCTKKQSKPLRKTTGKRPTAVFKSS